MAFPAPLSARPAVSVSARTILDRVLCSVDGSSGGFEAARQAAALQRGLGALLLVAAADAGEASEAGEGEARAAAAELAAELRLVDGRPEDAVLRAAWREEATLVAVCAPQPRRGVSVFLGRPLADLLQLAPCSVLLARPRPERHAPRSIVLGVDGSDHAASAADVAHDLAATCGGEVRTVAATGGRPIDVDGVCRRYPDAEIDWRPPADALVAASEESDLVVVGSRGLHGLSTFGSVSERVAHRARCSVLVVRSFDEPS